MRYMPSQMLTEVRYIPPQKEKLHREYALVSLTFSQVASFSAWLWFASVRRNSVEGISTFFHTCVHPYMPQVTP